MSQNQELEESLLGEVVQNEEDQRWIWRNRIPHGRVTLISGVGGIGKTRVICSFLTTYLKHGNYPDGQPVEEDPGRILFVTTENKPSELARVFHIQGCESDDLMEISVADYMHRDGEDPVPFDLDVNHAVLERAIKRINAKVVVIDPLREFHNQKDVDGKAIRSLMVRLDQLCEKLDIAIIAVIHWNKDEKKGRSNRMAGSHQYRDAVRSVIIVEEDEKTKTRHFIQDKMNLGPQPIALDFTIEEPGGFVAWKIVDDSSSPPPSAVLAARKWLVDNLAKGPLPISWILENIGVSRGTAYQAKNSMTGSIISFYQFDGKLGVSVAKWDIRCERNLFGLQYTGGLRLK